MKKLACILFLFIFLFNVGGYYFVFMGLQHHSDNNLLESIDSDTYASTDEVIISIPVTLPYPIHQQEFERVNGDFEFRGEYYKMVKQKLDNGLLILVCIRNHNQKKLTHAMTEFARAANNIPINSKAMNLLAKFFKDFKSADLPVILKTSGWYRKLVSIDLKTFALVPCLDIQSPPPKA